MKIIENPIHYTVIYQRQVSKYKNYVHQYLGSYVDIRDAVQSIVTAYRKNPNCRGDFSINISNGKPRCHLNPSKYKDEDLN
jgi:hypothetical protein